MGDASASASEKLSTHLAELDQRVERMATRPEEVKVGWLSLAMPFFRLLGWQPVYETKHLTELVRTVAEREEVAPDALTSRLEAAVEELDLDVKRAERVCVLHGRVAVAHLAWLARMIRVTQRIAAALADEQRGERALAAIDPVLVAPPLAIAIHPSPPSEQKTEPDLAVDRAQTRLVELQLAAIDHIIDAAREETGQLERRRSLLEAARRLLLDADASLPLDAEGVRARKRYLAEQIVQVDRLEATGLSPRVGLVHQARSALARGDRHRLRSALCALEGFAVTAGDASLGERVARALDGVDGAADPFSQESRQQSLGRSAGELFGGRVLDAVDRAYAESEGSRRARYEEALSDSVEGAVDLALAYLDEGKREQALAAMIAVDGCFDVGAPLVPVRVRNTTITARLVRHPTQDLVLTRARGPEDVPNAVITDPRTVLLDLATGRLLSRRYVRYEPQVRERVEMVGEARIYLLDGSTSMLDEGRDMARARMRDAILMAELATSMERFEKGDRHTRVVLYFRYFTKRIGPVTRVSRPNEALAAMAQVLEEPHRGGTDIEGALAASFETIRQARGQDPSLAQAQIVLITDGRAEVRPSLVEKARAPVGDLPIAVSVIALGEENPALRDLVAEQRRRGERAFYHFLDDDTLAALCQGGVTLGRSLHLEEGPADLGALGAELGQILDDLNELERLRHGAVISASEQDDELLGALAELGLDASALSDGQRARRDAAQRDRRAVDERFRQWFPLAPAAPTSLTLVDGDVESTLVVLGTVTEVIGEMGGDPMMRKADAVDIAERLLADAGLSPARYDAVVRAGVDEVAAAILLVHDAVDPSKRERAA